SLRATYAPHESINSDQATGLQYEFREAVDHDRNDLRVWSGARPRQPCSGSLQYSTCIRWLSPGASCRASSATLAVSMQSMRCQASAANCDRRWDLSIQGFQTTAELDPVAWI